MNHRHDPTGRIAHLLRPDTLAGSLIVLLSLTVGQRLVGFARSVLFCLWLDPVELGGWDMSFGFLSLAAPVVVLSLPAVFGRYVEHYRQRGQLRMFLRRTTLVTMALALTGALVVGLANEWFSRLIFGRTDRAELVTLLAVSLLAIVGYNFASELFTALRLQRLASGLDFFNSVTFALLAVGLLSLGKPSASSIVGAYGAACLLSMTLSLIWGWRSWRSLAGTAETVPQSSFWAKLVPFAAWVWVSNWLGNLFVIIDRYMIVHYSGRPADEALALVGQYHSSRIVPLVLVSVAGMVGTMLIPFLSHDWEEGRRAAVAAKLNAMLKISGLGMVLASVLVLLAQPWLFGLAFSGKFDVGLGVLSWALLSSVWFGMVSIAKAYLWCAEKVRLVGVAYLLGVVANVGLNLWLLPRFDLLGAVIGTCLAQLIALLAIYGFAMRHGMRFDAATWLVTAVPLTLAFGPWTALAAVAALVAVGLATDLLFSEAEKRECKAIVSRYATKLKGRLGMASAAEVVLEQT